jgi:glycosyltransferase involved in cell wall biosynthesis
MVFEVRDLWPESAIALSELKSKWAISFATFLEKACYRHAAKIVVVTEGIYNWLLQRGVTAEKLAIAPNGANVEQYTYNPDDRQRIRNELGLSKKFVVIYTGIHGLAQGLETILEAARLLKNDSRFQFVLIGDGPRKADLVSLSNSYDLSNLTMLPEKPREYIPGFLSAADVALVPLKRAEVFKGVVPSKIFDAWACELPVLISIDGEARQLVEKVKGGIFVPPEEPQEIVDAIIHLMNSPAELKAMGKNGRKYTVENNSRSILAEKLITLLESNITSK